MSGKEFPKLPAMFKKQFLTALRGGCYHFIEGTWYRPLSIEECEKDLEQGKIHEYGHCTLGAAYHLATGKNLGREGWMHNKVPSAFKDANVREKIMTLNDSNESFEKAADWIEENL